MTADSEERSFKPISVGSSVAPVPSELVGAIAKNEYIDFKLLLPSNLALLSVMPCKELRATKNCVWRKSYPFR